MSLKLRNAAKDAAVTLVDGGPLGSPSISMDVRDLFKNVQISGGTMTGSLEVPAGATGTEVPQMQEIEQLVVDAVDAQKATSGNDWIQFQNGTMICWGGPVSLTYLDSPTNIFGATSGGLSRTENYINFGKSFIGSPSVIVSATEFGMSSAQGRNITSGSFRCNSYYFSGSPKASYVAFGRWK